MNILLINSEFPPVGGGASNASGFVASNLSDLGQNVTVLTTQYNGLPKFETINGVEIRRIPSPRKYLDRSGPFEQLLFILIGSVWSLSIARKAKPDVTLAFFGAPSGFIAFFLKVFIGIPYIVSLRGGDVPGFRSYDFSIYHKLLGPFLRIVWKNAAYVVANSQGLKNLGNKFEPGISIQVIPNGVDIDQFVPVERSWSPPKLLTVGRIVYQKGLDILLESLKKVEDLDWELNIVGDGPKYKEIHLLAEKLGLLGHIHFLLWQNKNSLKDIYQQSNLFLNPSRDEGMPNVVLEAMASGLPVVATNIAGNEELISVGETGLLVEPEDVAGLAESLRQLIPDGKTRKTMGSNARKLVEENYTWKQVAQRNLDLLENVVKTKSC
ncbi:MAG: glycosyltransferase family 4 protein [Anaerolineales bacterium]|nr:glycosyltransferase family 4 protein [Anaerolineales bacterium]